MCGITGVLSTWLAAQEEEAWKELFLVSTLRGWDGAGVAVVPQSKKEQINIIKTTAQASTIIMGEKLAAIIKKNNRTKCLVGHTRWPTKGDNSFKNVHPHRHKHIIGVHNGTMFNIVGKTVEKGESDSILLIQAIAEHGIDDVVCKSFGAYALVWIDEKAQTINFIRNKDRPLWFAYAEHQKNSKWLQTLYWASERDFLDLVLSRRFNQKFAFEPLRENTLMSYSLNTKGGLSLTESREIARPFVQHWKPMNGGTTETDTRWPVGNVSDKISNIPGKPYGHDHRSHLPAPLPNSYTGTLSKLLNTMPDNRKEDVLETLPFEADPTEDMSDTLNMSFCTTPGHYISEDEFDRLLLQGCSWCTQQCSLDDFVNGKARWVGKSDYFCDDCAKNPDVTPYLDMYKGLN